MPRSARIKSSSSIYHVILRGINRQDIFEEDEDKKKFLWILRDCIGVSGCHIYAYCLMSNHVHILIGIGNEDIDVIMKRTGSRYVFYFNDKYGRVGHLFQDRFKSEVVENDRYFLTVVRYILQNPLKAGLESKPGNYVWSSYGAYSGRPDQITDISIATKIAGGKEKIIDFINESNDDSVLDFSLGRKKLSDDELRERLYQVTGCRSVTEYQNESKEKQKAYVLQMRKDGLSLSQIARLTGKSKTMIHKIVNG